MALLTIEKICLAFGDRDILRNVDLNLTRESRIALTGANGSGKSTLMKIIAGLVPPDSGNVHAKDGVRIAYLPQEGITHFGTTLYQEAELGFSYILPLIGKKRMVEDELGGCGEGDERVAPLLKKQHILQETINRSGYYQRKQTIEAMLSGLGFKGEELSYSTDTFSAGWQMRIALAKTLLSGPEVLLLDEPTNYLDIEARTWLKQYLDSYPGCFLLVSHDRDFLDSTVDKTAELFLATLRLYNGNYSAYEKKRQEELKQLYEEYRRQQEEIEKTEAFINKFRYNASKAKQVQSRIKYLEKLKPVAIPEHLKPLHLRLPPPERTGDIVIETDGLSKRYGRTSVFSNLRLTVERGEKIGVLGVNGAGKTTLLRVLAGRDVVYTGEIRYGSKVRIGYYAEELLKELQSETSVLELLEAEAPSHLVPKLRDFLGAFLFTGDDIYKPCSVLSGGEKSRLAILRMVLHPVNVLILDEPTNHLDIHSKDILLEALQNYEGTVLFVSHDRYFLDHLAGKILELREHAGHFYYGGFSYYLWKKGREETASEAQGAESEVKEDLQGKIEYEEEKRRKNEARQREREEKRLIERIEQTDKEISQLHALLNDPKVYSDHEESRRINNELKRAEKLQHQLMEKWEELA